MPLSTMEMLGAYGIAVGIAGFIVLFLADL